MRRKERKIENADILNEILTKSQTCRLAIHDEEFPYIIPMNYGYFEGSLYFHCAPEGKKIELLGKNNKVAFEITNRHELITGPKACDWTTKYCSIVGNGKVEFITDFSAKEKALDVIMVQHGKTDNFYSRKLVLVQK